MEIDSEILKQRLLKLKELSVQQNIDHHVSEYMRGMANGLILAVSTMQGGIPMYYDAPEKKDGLKKVSNISEMAKTALAVPVDQCLENALKAFKTNDTTKGFKHCIVIFANHEKDFAGMEYFVSGASSTERLGIAARFTALCIKKEDEL